MQRFHLIGNVGKQAEVRQTPKGQAIGFSVAVNESYKDKEGNKQEKTTWYKVTQWKKLGESTNIAEHLKPGQPVSIVGQPYSEAYINSENKAVAVQCVRISGSGHDGHTLDLVGYTKASANGTSPVQGEDDDDTIKLPRHEDDDNDLPF